MNQSAAKEETKRCGLVSIVGRPNVGKSTLLNQCVGEKITITSKIPQTTRQQIRGIFTDPRGQIVFIDTPGLHKQGDRLGRMMSDSCSSAMDGVDCIIYLTDVSRRLGAEERFVAEAVMAQKVPVIMGLNKIDLKKADVQSYIEHWESLTCRPITEQENFKMIAMSGLKGLNVDQLISLVFDFLPEGPLLYPEDVITDLPNQNMIADVVREKLFMQLKKEVPHSIGVILEDVQPLKRKTLLVRVVILVERSTQKEIVIGKKGEMLKRVGSMARIELEEFMQKKIFLEMHVRVEKEWRNNMSLLLDQGYHSNA